MLGIASLALLYAAWDGVLHAIGKWSSDEYSYGYFIPFLIAFFIWQRKHRLAAEPFGGAWTGVLMVFAAAFLLVFGELATLYTLVQYGFALGVMGLALSMLGWRAFRWVAVPLLLLFFAVPLPNFLYNNLSQSLQLISSKIGVWFVRLFDISVYL
ncbi:MAG: archaeosortase/exosortase family protein, partial [Pseudomonadales bacterium]|nr:archaeosortase/exosortase family protein [Pseudomonadales bacterium]